MKIKKLAFIRNLVLVVTGPALLLLIGLEWNHHHEYGHLVSYGLHIDVVSENYNIGIPGQTKLYRAQLSNYSLFPLKFVACDYVSDDFGKGTQLPYAVQRWDVGSKSWQTIAGINPDRFCQITPLSKIAAEITSRRLWPGATVEVMEGEATGALEPFRKGDVARFVVFRSLDTTDELSNAIPSVSFSIEDDVVRDTKDSFRVAH